MPVEKLVEDVDVAVASSGEEKPHESPKVGPVLEFPKSGPLRPPPKEAKLEFPKSGPLKPPTLTDNKEVLQSESTIEHRHKLIKSSN